MASNLNALRATHEIVKFVHPVTGEMQVTRNNWKPAVMAENVEEVTAFFGNLVDQVVRHIELYARKNVVVGCIAWLSHPRIINALRMHAESVLILVNDENYASWGNGQNITLYNALPRIQVAPATTFAHLVNTPIHAVHEINYAPVRCIRSAAGALMHSKYLVFFTRDEQGRQWPTSVWTGSMNYTMQSDRNQENALFVRNAGLARAYFDDFVNSFMRSDTLRTADNPEVNANLGPEHLHFTPQQKRAYAIKKRIVESRAKKTAKQPAARTLKTKAATTPKRGGGSGRKKTQ